MNSNELSLDEDLAFGFVEAELAVRLEEAGGSDPDRLTGVRPLRWLYTCVQRATICAKWFRDT